LDNSKFKFLILSWAEKSWHSGNLKLKIEN